MTTVPFSRDKASTKTRSNGPSSSFSLCRRGHVFKQCRTGWFEHFLSLERHVLNCYSNEADVSPAASISMRTAIVTGLFSPESNIFVNGGAFWSFVIRWCDTTGSKNIGAVNNRPGNHTTAATVSHTSPIQSIFTPPPESQSFSVQWEILHLGFTDKIAASLWYQSILDESTRHLSFNIPGMSRMPSPPLPSPRDFDQPLQHDWQSEFMPLHHTDDRQRLSAIGRLLSLGPVMSSKESTMGVKITSCPSIQSVECLGDASTETDSFVGSGTDTAHHTSSLRSRRPHAKTTQRSTTTDASTPYQTPPDSARPEEPSKSLESISTLVKDCLQCDGDCRSHTANDHERNDKRHGWLLFATEGGCCFYRHQDDHSLWKCVTWYPVSKEVVATVLLSSSEALQRSHQSWESEGSQFAFSPSKLFSQSFTSAGQLAHCDHNSRWPNSDLIATRFPLFVAGSCGDSFFPNALASLVGRVLGGDSVSGNATLERFAWRDDAQDVIWVVARRPVLQSSPKQQNVKPGGKSSSSPAKGVAPQRPLSSNTPLQWSPASVPLLVFHRLMEQFPGGGRGSQAACHYDPVGAAEKCALGENTRDSRAMERCTLDDRLRLSFDVNIAYAGWKISAGCSHRTGQPIAAVSCVVKMNIPLHQNSTSSAYGAGKPSSDTPSILLLLYDYILSSVHPPVAFLRHLIHLKDFLLQPPEPRGMRQDFSGVYSRFSAPSSKTLLLLEKRHEALCNFSSLSKPWQDAVNVLLRKFTSCSISSSDVTRFLIAWNGNVRSTASAITDFIRWRREFSIESLSWQNVKSELGKKGWGYVTGATDKLSRPVLAIEAGKFDFAKGESDVQKWILSCLYLVERTLEKAQRNGVEQFFVVVNASGVRFSHFCFTAFRSIASVCSARFPERLGGVLICWSSWEALLALKTCEPLLSLMTRRKIHVVAPTTAAMKEAVERHFPMGGESCSAAEHEWPPLPSWLFCP